MLLHRFFTYSITSQDNELITATVCLNKADAIYDGHFPAMPIVPGICQVQMVQEILCDSLQKPYRLAEAKDIKFLRIINPNEMDTLMLTIKLSALDDNSLKVRCQLTNDGVIYLKMIAQFNQDKGPQ